MVFASITFIYYFLPLFFLLYFIFRKNIKLQNIVTVAFSIIFYAWGEPIFVFILLFSTYLNYLFGKAIANTDHSKMCLFFAVVFNILLIFIFKYVNLISEILFSFDIVKNQLFLPLPIGISFYTFQSISYIVDVYRKDVEPQEKYINLLLYISMFPQLIAGPIVRYKTIEININERVYPSKRLYKGIERIVIGLGKKVIFANQLSPLVSDFLIEDIASVSIAQRVIGIIIYMMQLYFDFSGYSDIAIGIGKIIGFNFPENFNHPLLSFSMTDFWRKWHMSLSTFFRDYVYIPLGGNRHNHILNIIIVWFLTGIWHGAHINFVVWGLFLAIVIIIEKLFSNIKIKLPRLIGFVYFMFINILSFAIFYFNDYKQMIKFFDIFTREVVFYNAGVMPLIKENVYLIVFAWFLSMPIMSEVMAFFDRYTKKHRILLTFYLLVKTVVYIGVFVVVTMLLIAETNNPFLYMQF